MDVQREQPDFSTISGTSLRLSERDTIAIYRWGGLSWVTQFRDGYGEPSDAATWFRGHAGLLHSSRVGSVAAIETVEMLTPDMIAKIARLHERVRVQSDRRDTALTVLAAAFRRACAQRIWPLLVAGPAASSSRLMEFLMRAFRLSPISAARNH